MSLDENLPKSMSKSAMHATKSYNDPIVGANYNELQVRDLTGHLVGQILTIVDTAMEDPTRRKAMKDLVVDRMWDANWKIIDWMKAGGKEEEYPFRTYAYNPDIPRE
jgi:hypothetical protein